MSDCCERSDEVVLALAYWQPWPGVGVAPGAPAAPTAARNAAAREAAGEEPPPRGGAPPSPPGGVGTQATSPREVHGPSGWGAVCTIAPLPWKQ